MSLFAASRQQRRVAADKQKKGLKAKANDVPERRELRGSYIRLEDASGEYKTEFREYPTRGIGTSGFPQLRFDGLPLIVVNVFYTILSLNHMVLGAPGSCPFLPTKVEKKSKQSCYEPVKRRRVTTGLDGYCECCQLRYEHVVYLHILIDMMFQLAFLSHHLWNLVVLGNFFPVLSRVAAVSIPALMHTA